MAEAMKKPNEPDAQAAIPEYLAADYVAVRGMDTAVLLPELDDQMDQIKQRLIRCAAIVRVVEERGDESRFLRCGNCGFVFRPIVHWLRKIAYGQVLPDIVAMYHAKASILSRISALSVPEQRRIAEDKPLAVVELSEAGPTHRLVHPSRMEAVEAQQVFARDHIRDQGEQVSWLKSRLDRKVPDGLRDGGIVIDSRRGCILVSGDKVVLTAKKLLYYAGELQK